MAYYARSIVSDVEQGEKSFAQGLIEIETEHRSLSNQSREIALKGLGIVAGGFQIATGGVGICYVSVGTLCVIGAVYIGLSVTSLARRVLKPDAWRLFRYLYADNVRAYKTMHPISLTTEATIDAVTLKQIHEELKK